MTKAKTNVTSIVSTEESPSYKRQRMKEVRTMVTRNHKCGKRIDLMGFEGTDIPRAMIALQDLLVKSEERHRKATQHIAFAKNRNEILTFIMDNATKTSLEQQQRIAELSTALYNERVGHKQTAKSLNQCHKSYHQAMMDLDTVKRAQEILND